jgi:imidazolonepropionase-like amidohydrolase
MPRTKPTRIAPALRPLLLGCALAVAAAPAAAQTVALTGATVHPVRGPKIERGTVLLRGGRIVAVGGPELAVPADARRVDLAGKLLTPGLFHPSTDLGLTLTQTGAQGETREDVQEGPVNAAFAVADAVDPAAMTLPLARAEGITNAVSAPADGLVAGQAAVIELGVGARERIVVRPSVAMVAALGEQGKSGGGGSRAGAYARLRNLLRDAREFARRRRDFEQARIQPLSAPQADLEALQPVLQGRIPVYLVADRRVDIENGLRLAREFGLRLVLWSGSEAWQLADTLAARGVPVVVNAYADRPSFEAFGTRLDNAALLDRAGVRVLVSDENPEQAFKAQFRTLRFAAGEAVRNGLPWEKALAAITLHPAEAFGVAADYGSIEPGKVANLVVWSGDPLDFSGRVERVFVRGEELPLETRQTELLERYRTLPPKY